MALDLFVGPLCRYHAGDWKNVGQRIAEARGLEYRLITPGEPRDAASPEDIAEVIVRWQEWLDETIHAHGSAFEPWRDEPHLDYATDRPGWEGLSGLVHKYAYLLVPGLTEPATPPEFEKLGADPAYLRATQEPSLLSVLADVGLWIPGDFGFAFGAATLTGQPVNVASLALLDASLDEICQLWEKDRGAMRQLTTDQPSSASSLNEAALHGLVVFCRLADEALERRMPMILDY